MNFKLNVPEFVEKYLDKHNARYNRNCKIYDPPVWEYLIDSKITFIVADEDLPRMIFIYFTTLEEDRIANIHQKPAHSRWKWYHMLVIDCMGLDIYHEHYDLIPLNKNHSLSEVRIRFNNWCKHMLEEMIVIEEESL